MKNTSELSYRELIENFLLTRSEKDYNKLYVKVRPGLKSYIYNVIKDSDATDDILANTLAKLWVKIDQYNPEYQITTWLYKIAFNECLGYIRTRNRSYSIDAMKDYGIEITENNKINNSLESILEDTEMYLTEDYFYEEDNILQEQYQAALKSINSLKPMYRGIMQDRLLQEMKYEDIAEKYKMSLQTVKNRIRRGKMLIQRDIIKNIS